MPQSPPRPLSWLARRRPQAGDDGGFTLVEAMASLIVAALMFTGVAVMTVAATREALFARENQQASDAITEQLEQLRALDYAAVAMVASDLAGDSRVTYNGGTYTMNPGTGTQETIVTATTSSVNPHRKTVTYNNVPFTVSTYVTAPVDATGASYKRATVFVNWTVGGRVHSRSASTFVTLTRRGLPLPVFSWGKAKTYTYAPCSYAGLAAKATNLGARDRFNLTTSDTAHTWTWYVDDNADGVHQDTETTTASDTNGDGTVDTGLMETTGVAYYVAVRKIEASETMPITVSLVTTSVAQPTASGGSKSFTDTIVAPSSYTPSATCPTPKSYYLHATTWGNGNSYAQKADATAPTGSVTTKTTVRASTADITQSQSSKVIDWRYQLATTSTFSGSGSLTVYVSPSSGNTGGITCWVGSSAGPKLSDAITQVASVSSTGPWSNGTPQALTLTFSVSNWSVSANSYVVAKCESTSGQDMDFWYDSQNYQALLTLPVTAGG